MEKKSVTVQQQPVNILDYNVQILPFIKEAWQKTSGTKWVINLTTVILVVLALGLILIDYGVGAPIMGAADQTVWSYIGPLLLFIPTLPIYYGIGLLGIYCAAQSPLSVKLVFAQYKKFLPLLLLYLIENGIYVALNVGADYLGTLHLSSSLSGALKFSTATAEFILTLLLMMAPWLILEKGCTVSTSMMTSALAIFKHWFKIILYLLLTALVTGLPFSLYIIGISLGNNMVAIVGGVIGLVTLIWTVPIATIAVGILYREMFGVKAPASVSAPVVVEKET
jgi:hypothetical protein